MRLKLERSTSDGNPTQPPPRGGVPNGSQLGWFFLILIMPLCRDRRPRLSARNPLRHSRSCSLVRTDEGVCSYRWHVADSKKAFPQFEEGVSLMQEGRSLDVKGGSLPFEERLSLELKRLRELRK